VVQDSDAQKSLHSPPLEEEEVDDCSAEVIPTVDGMDFPDEDKCLRDDDFLQVPSSEDTTVDTEDILRSEQVIDIAPLDHKRYLIVRESPSKQVHAGRESSSKPIFIVRKLNSGGML